MRTSKIVSMDGFVVDADDYLVVKEILSSLGIPEEKMAAKAWYVTEIHENDEKRLKALNLRRTGIRALPPSIGRWKHLEDLDLTSSNNLSSLPNEIGSLGNLTTLSLSNSAVSSITPSIGRLQNLKNLNLSQTKKLSSLPEEISNLGSLQTLNLCSSDLKSLPQSIGNLKRLENLILTETGISSLPNSFCGLTSLRVLKCNRTGISALPEADLFEILSALTTRLPVLGCLGHIPSKLNESHQRKLGFAMARNRGVSRVRSSITNEDLIQGQPKLWPLVLRKASNAFQHDPNFPALWSWTTLSKPEAIHCLLAESRESFISLLLHPEQ